VVVAIPPLQNMPLSHAFTGHGQMLKTKGPFNLGVGEMKETSS